MSSMEEYLRRLREADERVKQRRKNKEDEDNQFSDRFGYRD